MGIVIRQSIKSSVGYYLGVLLGAINTLYISTQFLSTDQLATTRLLLENGLVFAAFAHLGAPNVCDRFLAKYKNKEDQNSGFLLFLIGMGLIGFIIFSLLFIIFFEKIQGFYQSKSPSISENLILCIPITFIWTYITIFESYIKGHQRIAIPTFLREVIFRLLNIILIIALGLNLISFSGFLIAYVLIMLAISVALIAYCSHLGHLYFNLQSFAIPKTEVIEMIKYGSFLLLGSIGVNLILFLDRNILASEIGPQAVAIFIIASYIASVIEIPSKSIKQISTPLLSQSVINKTDDKTIELYSKVAQNTMLIGGILLVMIFSNLESLLGIMPKAEIYKQGFWVIIILGSCKWVDMSLGLNAEMIAFSKYYKINTYLALGLAILAIVLNYLLIPYFGLVGSAIATGIITLISCGARLFLVQIKFGLNPFSTNSFKGFLIILFCMAMGFIIPSKNDNMLYTVIFIGLKSAILMTIFFLLTLYFEVSEDFQNLKISLINKIRQTNN